MKLTTNEIGQIEMLFNEFAEEYYLKKEGNNSYSYDIDIDYHMIDSIEDYTRNHADKTLRDIEDDLIEDFYSHNEVNYTDYYINSFIEEYTNKLENIKSGLSKMLRFDLLEYIELYSNFDIKHYIENTKIDVNIVLENDDSFDTEFSDNSFFNLFYYYDLNDSDELKELTEILKESSLSTLLYKQGYTLNQFINYIKTDESSSLDNDEVFQSILNEINNAQNYQALTVCRNITFKEYEQLKNSKQITINKNDVIGYHGFVDGSGSLFEIKLNNVMVFDTNDINIHIDNTFGYGLIEVYGSYMIA